MRKYTAYAALLALNLACLAAGAARLAGFSPLLLLCADASALSYAFARGREGKAGDDDPLVGGLVQRAVIAATRSPFEVIRASADGGAGYGEALMSSLRGFDPAGALVRSAGKKGLGAAASRLSTAGQVPSPEEIASLASRGLEEALASASSSIETRHALLQGCSFFLPVMICLFYPAAAASPVDSANVAVSVFFFLCTVRSMVWRL
ncbi:MAG: hypothetical protein JRN39_05910 [Nitrososphaerota archaeon]|nr:hypothetical protein [Nitrososphaerota archaeon]MDG6939916.1 hypothetical protein [Nitrososphaerota archaeon]